MFNRETSRWLHPFGAPSVAIAGVEVQVAQESDRLVFRYRLDGDVTCLKLPALGPPTRADRLWEHTCFEAFIRAGGAQAYYELNFSPSRQWAAYAFRAYRDVAGDITVCAPEISVQHDARRIELVATVAWQRFPLLTATTELSIGLSAVIEAGDGRLSYWALTHPSTKPDFHHPESFALEFALPG